MSDIVERLNAWRETPFDGDPMIDALLVDVPEAAEEIQSLRQRVERLEGALREAVDVASGDLHMMKLAVEAGDPKREILCRIADTGKVIDEARAALSPKVQEGE